MREDQSPSERPPLVRERPLSENFKSSACIALPKERDPVDHDLVQTALKPHGFALDFWRIAMRPGKPLIFGRLKHTPFVGLPGNPVSAMVCAVLFIQPAIAAMWYERALQTPGLDQESILALRYDLGVSQALAGDVAAARKSFSQVYGMNIDYRDVADRLASLGKGQ